jgi:hypothetical protein
MYIIETNKKAMRFETTTFRDVRRSCPDLKVARFPSLPRVLFPDILDNIYTQNEHTIFRLRKRGRRGPDLFFCLSENRVSRGRSVVFRDGLSDKHNPL